MLRKFVVLACVTPNSTPFIARSYGPIVHEITPHREGKPMRCRVRCAIFVGFREPVVLCEAKGDILCGSELLGSANFLEETQLVVRYSVDLFILELFPICS